MTTKELEAWAKTAGAEQRLGCCDSMITALRNAERYARLAGARQTLKRIKLAISSAQGAYRNAGYRVSRASSAKVSR